MDRNSGLFRIPFPKIAQKLNFQQISPKLKMFRPKIWKNDEFFYYQTKNEDFLTKNVLKNEDYFYFKKV